MRYILLLQAALLLPLSTMARHKLQGTITNAENGQALPYAAVRISGTFSGAYSDAEGRYAISGLAEGRYAVEVSLLGYTTLRDTVQISGDAEKNFALRSAVYLQQEVVVQATRAGENSAMASSQMNREDIAAVNFGQDIPVLLNMLPSVVSTSDAGAGVGYTGIRIRGTDATRINVTVNGIPINDAESQGVFWVNMPDFASSVQSIQVQRGVGTSTNGAGAFGGSVNMQTDGLRDSAFTDFMISAGSFNTRRVTLKTGTGLLNNHWAFDGRLSRITSDGYIDRAASTLQSWQATGGWYGDRGFVKAVVFGGSEKTYQAWYGVPEDSIKTGNFTYNPAGEIYDSQGNITYYNNETDNYKQTHYQLITAWTLNEKWALNAALHATRGLGYYEQYKAQSTLADYNLANVINGNDTLTESDLVRRLWLDNWFYGITWGFTGKVSNRWQLIIGGAANQYTGDHYGTVEWTRAGAFIPKEFNYYFNNAVKNDVTVYAKSNLQATQKINLFADLQTRFVSYEFEGFDRNGNNVTQQADYFFFNPKVGITYTHNNSTSIYASISAGSKEPNRDDHTESSPESRPKAEKLYDAEAGLKFAKRKFRFGANLFYMYYIDQLVVTGKINDVGAYTRQNADKSLRAGIELETAWQPFKKWSIAGNIALSQNKIFDYTEFVDDYDNGGQIENRFGETDIALSPGIVAAAQLNWMPLKPLTFTLTGKHVGRQFLDNTSNRSRSLDAYTFCDLRMQWKFEVKSIRELSAGIQINNVLNTQFSSNGYTFGYISGGLQQFNYYFPQAGRNFMLMLSLRF
ncbi:MAG: TonB-dependent receptor [Bacteroidota bacterium]